MRFNFYFCIYFKKKACLDLSCFIRNWDKTAASWDRPFLLQLFRCQNFFEFAYLKNNSCLLLLWICAFNTMKNYFFWLLIHLNLVSFSGGRGTLHHQRSQNTYKTCPRFAQVHPSCRRIQWRGLQFSGFPQRRHSGRYSRKEESFRQRGLHSSRLHYSRFQGATASSSAAAGQGAEGSAVC